MQRSAVVARRGEEPLLSRLPRPVPPPPGTDQLGRAEGKGQNTLYIERIKVLHLLIKERIRYDSIITIKNFLVERNFIQKCSLVQPARVR